MKKFRKGDLIALKSNPGFIYIVDEFDGKEWLGTSHEGHIYERTIGTSGCHLGNKPKEWRVVKRADSKKDQRIEELEKQLESGDEALKDALNSAAEQAKKMDAVLLDRDLAMLEAGYVSLERLRRNTMAPMTQMVYGVARQTEVGMRLRKPNGGSDSSYLGVFLDKMKGD